MEDITKTGPVGLKGLSYNESPSPEEGYKEAYSQIMNAFSSKSDIMPQDFMSGTRNVGSELLQYGVGNSKFDEGIFYSQIENIGDYRANQQSGLGQVANGLAKGVVLAGTTFLDGIVGAIIGGAKAIEEGRWSALWDNEFSKGMESLNDAMEKALPNYYTNYDQEHPLENIFSANFLGDKFIKNLGFSVGAFYSGGLYAGGVKAVGKGAMKVAKGLGATTKTIKGISNATGIAASALGVVSSAVNEGRIEALHNSTDWYKYQKAIIDDTYSQRLNSLKSFEGTFMYESMLAKEQEAYDATIAKLNEDRLKMGNADLLMNLPILMASNTIQFAKLYSKGYRTAKKNFNILGSPGKYTAGTTKASAAWGITKGALSEGTEEISQRAASDISGNYYATDVNNFYKAAIDPEAEQETLSWIKSFASGINSTVNDDSAWEEFLIGSLTGFLGIPTFRSTRSKEGKIQLPIQLQGGAFNEWKEYKELAAREKELVKQLNDRINSPEYLNYYQGLIRHNGYQRLMDSAIERGDEFNFKNAEHAQLVSDIIMFDEAGKLEDLKMAIEEAASMSEDDLKALVVNTTAVDNNGNLIGPYAEYAVKDENGNISAVFGSSNSIKDIQNSLRNNRDTILKSIDKYQKTKDNLLFEVGDKFSPKQIEELTWMKTQIENWEERSKDTAALVSSEIDDIIENLKLRTQTFSSDTESIPSLEEKRILNQISVLEKLRAFKPENLAHILYNNIDVYKLLLDITQNTEGIVREAGKQNFVTNLADLLSMADAINTYVSKLEEYLKNPEKLTEDNNIAHAEQEAKAKRTTIVNATNRVNNSKVSDLVRESDSGNIDLNSIDALFEESEEDVTEAKAKIEEVRGINNAHRRLASAGSILDKLAGEDPEKQKAARDAKTLLNNSKAKADSVEEFLDVDREAFLDPSVLYDEELYAELSGDNEAIQSALNDALDSARSLIQQAKQILDDENTSLSDIPTAQEGIVERVMGTTGHDATTSTVPVNSTNASDAEVSPYVFATPSVSPDKFSSQKEDTEKAGNKFFSDLGNYWKPSMSQFPIHRIAGDDRPFHQILRDSNYTYLYSRGNNIFETIVYSKEEVDKIEKVYNYLLDRGAFSIVDSGQIQPGEKITFFTDKTLNEQVGEVVILIKDSKGRVIGNLVSENSKIRDSQASLKAFRDEFMEQYEAYNATNDTEDTTFEYGESTVAKNMVGKPQYTAKNNRLPLNRIFPNGFKLGIAMTSGRNANIVVSPGRKKAQGQTKFERAILSPLDAVSGQPFVLLPTSRKQNGEVVNITIPFLMPSFNNETRNSLLGKEIENIIESFSSIKTDAQAAAAKFELQELLAISDLHINIVNGELIVSLIAPGETKQTTIYKGNPTSPNMVSSIINGLVAMNIPFQISRKYINTTYNNRDYNAMIGELAETNLPANTTNTVNEWFTINPISKGKEIKAKSPKTTGLNPNRAMPSYQEISIGNMQFTINSKTNEVLDSEGQPYNGKYANHVKAKAHAIKINAKPDSVVKTDWGYYDLKIDDFVTQEDELENLTNGKIERTLETTDTPKTYSKERIKELLSKRGVRGLAASYLSNELNTKNTLFEGKTIEDFDSALDLVSAMLITLIAKKATIDEIKNRLANSNSWQLLQVGSLRVGANLLDILEEYGNTVNEPVDKRILDSVEYKEVKEEVQTQESKPKSKTPSKSLISTKESKEVWGALTPEQQDTLLSMSPAKQKAMMEHLKAAYSIGADLGSVINVASGTKHREATSEAYQPWNEERELKWLSRALPSLSSDERIRVVNGINGLIPIGDTGRFAYGRFRNGIIEIGRNAARGTVYHEAFHAVTHTLLSEEERTTLFSEAKNRYGDLGNITLEEKLAEDFRRYVQIGESGFYGVVNRIFRTIKHLVKQLFGKEAYIDNLFYRINRGKLDNINYKNSPNIDNNTRYKEAEVSWYEEHIEAEKERLQKTIKALKTAPSINSTISFSDGTFKRYDSVEYLTERDARSVINKEMSPEFREAYDVREKTGRYHIIKRPQKTIKEKIDEVRRITERTIREYERAIVEIENIRNIEASRQALESQEVYYREVEQYHMSKYDLGKLSEEDKAYIRSRGISIEEYINMSYYEKDALFRCM